MAKTKSIDCGNVNCKDRLLNRFRGQNVARRPNLDILMIRLQDHAGQHDDKQQYADKQVAQPYH